MTSLAQKQGELYGFITAFMWPPEPMTVQEYCEWWERERAPLLRDSGVTMEQAAEALSFLAAVSR